MSESFGATKENVKTWVRVNLIKMKNAFYVIVSAVIIAIIIILLINAAEKKIKTKIWNL